MKYKFQDIAINSTTKKKPEESDKYHYIGLEHLDPGNLFVQKYGSEVAPIGEKLVMKKGDVLFGKRRAYQKKVAIAPCDGIFSAHGMVLRPNEDIVNKEYFPFFINSDNFLNEAIRISVGSLSPTINWRDLKELEFDLPPIEEQERLAKRLWAAYELKESYKKLIVATDEMVKAQFFEMFGDPDNNKLDNQIVRLEEVLSLVRNGANIKQIDGEAGFPITRIETIADRTFNRSKMGYAGIKDIHKYSEYILQHNDILMSHINSVGHIGKSAIYERLEGENIIHGMNLLCLRPIPEKADSTYLYFYFQMPFFRRNIGKITKKAINQASFTTAHLKEISLLLPNIQSQKEFSSFAKQADKSKAELRQSIEKIDNVMKSLLP